MLTAHQIGGWLTLAAMTATVVTGQLLINSQAADPHAGHVGHGGGHAYGYHGMKKVFAWTTVGTYSATALLSLFTPPPMIRRNEWNTISWHKGLAVIHFTGMFVTPFLELLIEDNHDAQIYHQVSGYTTIAAMAGAMLIVTF